MRTIHVHGSAESDLIDIWRYSFEQWGELQADEYLDELDSGIRKLADNPESDMRRCARGAACCLWAVTLSITRRRPILFISSESCTGAWIRTGIWNKEFPAAVRSLTRH